MGNRPTDATEAIKTHPDLNYKFTLEQEIFILIKYYRDLILFYTNRQDHTNDFEIILEEFINKYKELCQTHQH